MMNGGRGFCIIFAILWATVVDAALTRVRLEQIIQEEKIDRVSKFVNSPALPYEYRIHFRPLQKAIPIQPATRELPRIVAYGEDARFIFTFNGGISNEDSDEKVNEVLEIAEFSGQSDARRPRFDYYSVEFFPGKKNFYKISERNRDECTDCHSQGEPMSAGDDQILSQSDINLMIERLRTEAGEREPLIRYQGLDWAKRKTDHLAESFRQLGNGR